MESLLSKCEQCKYYEDLYSVPWLHSSHKLLSKNKIRIGLINVPCGGFGDIIVTQNFYNYLKEWYPHLEVVVCTTSIQKFKSLGINTNKFIQIKVKGGDECEPYSKLYFSKKPKPFDMIICIPIINDQFNINQFKKFIPYANLFNTFTVSEYNGLYGPYTFPIGVGENQLGLFLTKHKTKPHTLLQKPYALVYIADRSNPAGIHCRLCFLTFLDMICKKYSKEHSVFQVVVPPWIVTMLSESANFKSKFRQCVKHYYSNVWIVNSDESKDIYFHGKGNLLLIRGDILPQPREIFISLIKQSVEDVLLTGDQSITDAFSCCSRNKKIWYQIAPWKQDFAQEMSKSIPNPNFETFRTSCGSIQRLNFKYDYHKFLKQYDFRKLGNHRMNQLLNFHYKKNDPLIKDFMEVVLTSRKISSVIKKLKLKYNIK
jgi:hypothetical protein